MGDGFVEYGPMVVLHLLNMRFAPGKPLDEMVQLQKDSNVFEIGKPLKDSYSFLNIVPSHEGDRDLFFKFLDNLKKCPSDIAGTNGHDRIIAARRENLTSAAPPLPIYTKTHPADTDARVIVTKGQPIPHELQEYVIISSPTKPSKPVVP